MKFTLKCSFINLEINGFLVGIDAGYKLDGTQKDQSNANSWTSCKFRENATGINLDFVGDQYFQGCTIEGNNLGVLLNYSYVNFVSCHFENINGTNIKLKNISGSYTFGCYFATETTLPRDFVIDEDGTEKFSRIVSVGDVINSGLTNYSSVFSLIIAPRNSYVNVSTASGTTNNQTTMDVQGISAGNVGYSFGISNFYEMVFDSHIATRVHSGIFKVDTASTFVGNMDVQNIEAHGTFTADSISTLVGNITAQNNIDVQHKLQYSGCTSYTSDAAATADPLLPSGGLYKLDPSRAVRIKL